MSNEETKIFLVKDGEEIELPSYNEEEIKHPTLEGYTDFIMGINDEKFNVKILKSDFEKIKNLFR